jgi:carbon starvation protein
MLTGEGAYRFFWVLFGTSNQLLSALTLLGISVWLRREGRRSAYTWVPMAFVMVITVWSLALQAAAGLRSVGTPGAGVTIVNGLVSILLMALALILVREAARAVRGRPAREATAA